MKRKNIVPIIICVAFGLASCKKGNNAPIEGKWQEVKMVTYNQDNTIGVISGDTTFQANTFGSFDYMQFNNDATCVLSETGLIINSLQQLTKVQEIEDYTYVKAGAGFSLTRAHTNPSMISGIGITHAVTGFSANTLTLHSVTSYLNPSVPYKTISDAYYVK